MIFPERVLGRSSLHSRRFGRASFPIFCATWSRIWASISGGPLEVALERHERDDRLARELVRLRHDGSLGDLLVGHDRRLDLGGREAMPRDVDHVVDPSDDPQVSVLVADRCVPDQVGLGAEARPVRLDVALVVAVERAQHRGPRAREHEQPLALLDAFARLLVDHVGDDARQRVGRRARLGLGQPGEG